MIVSYNIIQELLKDCFAFLFKLLILSITRGSTVTFMYEYWPTFCGFDENLFFFWLAEINFKVLQSVLCHFFFISVLTCIDLQLLYFFHVDAP